MRRVRLTEGQLHNVIRESVNNILNEISRDLKKKCMDKSYDLGRNSQGGYFANNLCDDLNSQYSYSNNRGNNEFGPYGKGIRLHNRTYFDSNKNTNPNYYTDHYDTEHEGSSDKYSPRIQNMEDRDPRAFKNYYRPQVIEPNDNSRNNIPAYRNAKSELDRLSKLGNVHNTDDGWWNY